MAPAQSRNGHMIIPSARQAALASLAEAILAPKKKQSKKSKETVRPVPTPASTRRHVPTPRDGNQSDRASFPLQSDLKPMS